MNVQNQVLITEDGVMYLITYDDNGNITKKQEVTVVPPKIQKKRKTGFKPGGFYTVNFAYNDFLATKYGVYNSVTKDVLNELFRRLEFNNRIGVFTQKEIAGVIKSSQANVSRAIKALVDDKVIYKKDYYYYFTEEFVDYAHVDERGKKK